MFHNHFIIIKIILGADASIWGGTNYISSAVSPHKINKEKL